LWLNRAVLARHLSRQAVDPAELGSQPGREHHGPAAAVDHRRAHEHAVARVGGLGLRHRITDPRCRAAFTGQGCHLYQQVMRVNQPAIRRDGIPRIQQHQVTRNQVNGGDLGQLTITDHARGGRDQRLQRLSRPFRGMLLRETDDGVQ
jgi:hypothetical protein